MNKILLLILLGLSISFTAYSQCTPVNFPGPALTSPDTTQGLSPAVATIPYHEVISVRIPHDTLIPPLTIPVNIDSAGVLSITGLPPGMSYVTNSLSDFWPGGSYGCILIQGTVAEADTGTYTTQIQVQVVVAGNPLAFTYPYEIEVLDSINAGFSNKDLTKFTVHQNVPNPFDNKTIIKFNTLQASLFTFEVYNVIGNKVYKEELFAPSGVNKITFRKENLGAGVYFFRLSNDKNSIVKRMVIK